MQLLSQNGVCTVESVYMEKEVTSLEGIYVQS